jgi:hypothetical protein
MSNLTLPQVETSCCWTSVHLSQPEGKSPPQDFVLGGIINHPNWVLTSNFCIPIDAIDVAILFISCLGVHVFSKGWLLPRCKHPELGIYLQFTMFIYIYIVYIDIDIFTLYIFLSTYNWNLVKSHTQNLQSRVWFVFQPSNWALKLDSRRIPKTLAP